MSISDHGAQGRPPISGAASQQTSISDAATQVGCVCQSDMSLYTIVMWLCVAVLCVQQNICIYPVGTNIKKDCAIQATGTLIPKIMQKQLRIKNTPLCHGALVVAAMAVKKNTPR